MLESINQPSDAAQLYEKGGQFERAASIYISTKNFNLAKPIMAKVRPGRWNSPLLAPSPSTIRNTRFGGDISGLGISVDRPTVRSFALYELITPQIDQFVESRFRRDLTPQFLMVEGVGPSSTL